MKKTNKEYYEENKEYLLQVSRAKYAMDEDFRENVKNASIQRYLQIQKNKELKQLYNENRREYMREYMKEYRKRKKNNN
mgnify:CR=1 FL=1